MGTLPAYIEHVGHVIDKESLKQFSMEELEYFESIRDRVNIEKFNSEFKLIELDDNDCEFLSTLTSINSNNQNPGVRKMKINMFLNKNIIIKILSIKDLF